MTMTTAAPGRPLENLRSGATPTGDTRDGVRAADLEHITVSAQETVAAAHPAPGPSAPEREERVPWVAFACYAVAVVSLAVSLNTSWRFFDRVLHIGTDRGERYVMFAVAELALCVAGAGMAVNVHREGRPGSFRTIVWSMCGAMAYMAWAESAPSEAIGRIVLGPVLGTVMLHLGLGLTLRARHQHTGAVARIVREVRERCLSRLGLADDGRDAAQRTRDRKAYAAAALSRPRRWPWSREARLERALLAAGVADDLLMRDRMLARLAVVQHAQALAVVSQPSPWTHAPTARNGALGAHENDDRAAWPEQHATAQTELRTAHQRTDAGRSTTITQARRTDAHCGSAWGSQRASVNGAHASHTSGDPSAAAALAPLSASRERTLTPVRDSAARVGRNGRPRAAELLDSGAIERHRPLAESLVREGVTSKPVELVATILAERETGTPPTTIGRQYRVHHTTVGRILDAAAQEKTG